MSVVHGVYPSIFWAFRASPSSSPPPASRWARRALRSGRSEPHNFVTTSRSPPRSWSPSSAFDREGWSQALQGTDPVAGASEGLQALLAVESLFNLPSGGRQPGSFQRARRRAPAHPGRLSRLGDRYRRRREQVGAGVRCVPWVRIEAWPSLRSRLV